MGNKLYVDAKVSEIEDIINLDNSSLKNIEIDNEETGFQNLKVWRFYETNDDTIKSEPVLLPNIKEDHFLLSSLESYIILLIYKGKDDISDVSAFPTSLWGIVESSSNMTPRGLKYAFATSNDKMENLESFLLSKRDFKNSDFKYVVFIWNGKNCAPLIKSTVLMRAFDLDKKLSNAEIIPYLYYGYSVKENSVQKGKTVKLNDILSNTFETLTEDNLQTPSSDSFVNYQETVYLLQWLYPDKKVEKKSPSKKRILFKKFNSNFLNNKNRNYYDLFLNLDKSSSRKTNYEEREVKEPFKLNPLNLEKKREKPGEDMEDLENNDINESVSNSNSNSNGNDSLNSMNEVAEEEEEGDFVDDIPLDRNLNEKNLPNKFNLKKINIGDIYNKTNSSTDTDNNSSNAKIIKVPKLNMKLQHKLLSEDIISQRTKQISEDEEKLDTLASNTIRKASDMILGNKETNLKKLDLKGLDKGQQVQTSNFNLNFKVNLKQPSRNSGNQVEKEQDVMDIDKINEDYDLKETDRKKVVMDYFSKTMSEIIDGFLFLSSYNVAKNKDIVYNHKITHILNSAADVCQNHFPEDITYLSFNLKDHAMENIECLFYEIIKFIEGAREKGGRVLVHCIQGISRSVTFVIAYLIFTKKLNYDEAFKIVQARRSIASPNLGFAIQLQNFYQRLFEPPHTFRLYPKIFAIGSFQVEQPEKIVCRLTQEQFFEQRLNNSIRVFDKRGVYIIVTVDKVYMWIGSMIFSKVKEHYLTVARNYIQDLKKYENAPTEFVEVEDGKESKDFLSIWFDTDEKLQNFLSRSRFSEIGNETTNWYKDIDIQLILAEKKKKESSDNLLMKNDNNNLESNGPPKVRKAFYIYPEEDNPENIIDLDDLGNDDFFVACLEDSAENKYTMFIWKGPSVQVDPDESKEYLETIKSNFFPNDKLQLVTIIEEVPYSESDEFINML